MSEIQQARFEGWAVVDVLGHQRYVGFVTTEAFGQAVLFRVDVPPLPERERVTKSGEYVSGKWVPAGATVKEGATQAYTKLIGAGSIYTITPCSKEAAEKAVDDSQPRPLLSVTLPEGRALPPVEDGAYGGEPSDPDDEVDFDDIDEDEDEAPAL